MMRVLDADRTWRPYAKGGGEGERDLIGITASRLRSDSETPAFVFVKRRQRRRIARDPVMSSLCNARDTLIDDFMMAVSILGSANSKTGVYRIQLRA